MPPRSEAFAYESEPSPHAAIEDPVTLGDGDFLLSSELTTPEPARPRGAAPDPRRRGKQLTSGEREALRVVQEACKRAAATLETEAERLAGVWKILEPFVPQSEKDEARREKGRLSFLELAVDAGGPVCFDKYPTLIAQLELTGTATPGRGWPNSEAVAKRSRAVSKRIQSHVRRTAP